MIKVKIGCTKLLSCCIDRIDSLANHGDEFALIRPYCVGVTRLNGELCPIETIETAKKYTRICYDEQEGCFWASAEGKPRMLFRLNMDFCEIGCLHLSGACGPYPNGMSCSPCHNTILLVYPEAIAYVDKTSGECRCTPCIRYGAPNQDVLALCQGHMVSYVEGGRQCIDIRCSGCGEQTRFCVPEEFYMEAMILCGIQHTENPDCTVYEITLFLLNRCRRELSALQIFVSCCEETPHPHPQPCPSGFSCQCGKYEIMHSIALEEAGLAHILNAEGEKIQKAVAGNTSIQDLLKINESVRRTIAQVTQLEGVLYSKLETLTGICEEDHHHQEEDCHPCYEEMPLH